MTELGRRTRKETGKGNEMKALRFLARGRHQISMAFPEDQQILEHAVAELL